MQDTLAPSFFAALSAVGRAALFTDAGLRTLQAAFASIPDPRERRGQRYDLPFLLICLVVALLCDCNSLEAVGRWTRDQRTLSASTRLTGYLRANLPFPRIARLVRLVRTAETTTTDTVYLITALTPRYTDPDRLLTLIHGHWRIDPR